MKITSNAKVIVAGEHAVLAGHPALVVPIKNKQLIGSFRDQNKFDAICFGSNMANATDLWRSFIIRACELRKCEPRGIWTLNIDIPIGAGLGFSSALAVLTAKWMAELGYLPAAEIFSFAHELEQPIHGFSSGCDVAGALANDPIIYNMIGRLDYLSNNWRPNLAWSSTNSKSNTKDQILKVRNCQNINITTNMANAAKSAISAWQTEDLYLLATAMNKANEAFKEWGLVTAAMQAKMDLYNSLGAIACKPTGAGGGGCILSLWPKRFELGELNWIH